MTLLSQLSCPNPDPLVDVDWVQHNLSALKPVDGTWVLPNDAQKLAKGALPSAVEFDLDKIADTSSRFSHILPSKEVFAKAVGDMGISETDTVLCYDRHGMFSAPRLWWTFKMFGHKSVYILDGGLPAWVKAGFSVEDAFSKPNAAITYSPNMSLAKVTNLNAVKSSIGKIQTVDARPSGRYDGTSPEPRADLRSGHIPQSLSLPFGSLKTADGYFKPLDELAERTGASGIDLTAPIITSCGSGITAAGLAFTFHRLGARDVSVYDGSWAEWGSSRAPVTNPSAN